METPVYNKITQDIIDELTAICGAENVLYTDEKALRRYAGDQVPEKKYRHMPDVVVKPASASEIAAIMKLANREMIPVTPRAAGSGLSGGAVPIFGGILISVERMDKIIEIDTANLMAVVEPGVVTNRFDSQLKEHGLFFAGYPMSEEFCFIGGNVAENAGGGRAIKYGVTGRYIHGVEVVTPTGDVMQFGGKRIKDVTGYDLVSLMVGSEGTLGIFTKVFIKLLPRPTYRVATLSFFKDVSTAIKVVSEIMTSGKLIPTAIELMDHFCFSRTAEFLKQDYPVNDYGAVLLFEVDGNDPKSVRADAATIQQVCKENEVMAEYTADTEEGMEPFWKVRKQIPWILKRASSHVSFEDIVVPIANIPALLDQLNRIAAEYDIHIPVFGHAGDGNIHASPLKNPEHSTEQWEEMQPKFLRDIYLATADLGGTISGEHGIGHKRKQYMELVMSAAHLDILRSIKLALDPNLVLNPGKIFDI